MAEGVETWVKPVLTVLVTLLLSAGGAYLAINSRLLILGEQFRYTEAALERTAVERAAILREFDRAKSQVDELRWRVRALERLLKVAGPEREAPDP